MQSFLPLGSPSLISCRFESLKKKKPNQSNVRNKIAAESRKIGQLNSKPNHQIRVLRLSSGSYIVSEGPERLPHDAFMHCVLCVQWIWPSAFALLLIVTWQTKWYIGESLTAVCSASTRSQTTSAFLFFIFCCWPLRDLGWCTELNSSWLASSSLCIVCVCVRTGGYSN